MNAATHFHPKERSRRYGHWYAYRSLTSAPIILGFTVPLLYVGPVIVAMLVGVVQPGSLLASWAFFLGSIALAFLLIFTFASTYYRYRPLPTTVDTLLDKGSGDIADVSHFNFVGILSRGRGRADADRLEVLIHDLIETEAGEQWLRRLQLDENSLLSEMESAVIGKVSWADFCQSLLRVADAFGSDRIFAEHALAAFLLQPAVADFLREAALQEKDIIFMAWWLSTQHYVHRVKSRWWDRDRILAFTGVGLSWTAGFTPLVDRFARFPRGNLWDQYTVGRRTEMNQLVDTLARQTQSNVLLVGQPGVGRFGLVRELSRRVLQGRAHPKLDGQRVVYIHIGELLAEATTSASQLSIISQVLREMEQAGNIIAIIDGLGSVLGDEGETRINLTEVLLPFFSSLTVRVVVIISSDEYHLRLKANDELVHLFEIVQVPSATEEQTLQVLAIMMETLEERTGIEIPYRTLRSLVRTTRGVLQNTPYPERAFDVLEESLVVAESTGSDVLTEAVVSEVVSRKVGVPVGKVLQSERDYLLNLEEIMHRRIVNQHRAVSAIARALIRARAGVRDTKKPIGTFLFLGPTGVGKTETAKTLAQTYFGSEDYLARLDMSEYQGERGIELLLGSSTQPVGRLASIMMEQPFTVLLLDEFEKAHPMVHQLFLQILDEGRITDARGQQVAFNHAIIIATSNAGAELIRQTVHTQQELPPEFDDQLREHILGEAIMRPELLNRFDGVITFTPLTRDHIKQIAQLMLKSLNRRLDAQHGVQVTITDELVEYLATIGYDPQFGARPMNRALKNKVEYAVARMVLQGDIRPGEPVLLTPEQLTSLTVEQPQ